jgi:replication fork clamp-binding protein CrfC
MAEVSSSPSEILDQLQQETLRLIKVQRLMYEKLLEDPELLEESNPDQSLDRARVRSALEQLDGEAAKVTNYEMVLAVVGTMKAGKSTCINAIVGTEVLPNRSEPMTAIPTLIRHVKGQVEPKLRMQNPEPLVKLVREIAQNLKDQNVLRSPEYIEISGTPDGKELIATVLRGKGLLFDGEHVGPDQIFSFLKGLNDLVRLSGAVGIPFPFDEYNEMDEYPVIEVEYFHLRDQDVGKGSFTILDTPGPNEAGNPHLKVMLRDQLKKASALLAVVDYTQVKSEADTDVRDQLLETIALVKCRAYVLVNKYDQKDRNDKRTVDQLRAQIAQDRLSGKVSSDVVFPVFSSESLLEQQNAQFLGA